MQPITAAREAPRNDGLRGAIGWGVLLPGQGQDATDPLDPRGDWRRDEYQLVGPTCTEPPSVVFAPGCGDPTPERSDPERLLDSATTGRSFWVEAGVTCSTFGSPLTNETLPEFRSEALRRLDLCRWPAIAREVWAAEQALAATPPVENKHLASEDAVVLAEDPVGLVAGLGMLERALGDCSCGQVSMIHVDRSLVAHLDHAGVVHTTAGSGRLWTATDTLVVADTGYPGTAPGGADPDEGVAWMYGTGPMTARLGAVDYSNRDGWESGVSAPTNDVGVWAVQPVAISWQCCHFAVPVITDDGA